MARKIRKEKAPGLDFHWKFGDFEINTVRKKYTNSEYRYDNDSDVDMQIPVELVKWQTYADYYGEEKRSCFVVALWTKTDEDCYELQFVGGRPFEHISPEEISRIWPQLSAAQTMLDEYAATQRA